MEELFIQYSYGMVSYDQMATLSKQASEAQRLEERYRDDRSI